STARGPVEPNYFARKGLYSAASGCYHPKGLNRPFCLAGISQKLQEVFYGRRQRKWIHVVSGRTGNWGSGGSVICTPFRRRDAGSHSGQGRRRPRFRKEPRPPGSRSGRRLGGTRQGCRSEE